MKSPFTAYALLFYFLYNVAIHWTIYHVKLLMLSLIHLIFSIFTSSRRVCLTKFFLFNGLIHALFILSRMKFCVGFCSSCNSKLFWLLFFEPLSIAFDTLQVIQSGLLENSLFESQGKLTLESHFLWPFSLKAWFWLILARYPSVTWYRPQINNY